MIHQTATRPTLTVQRRGADGSPPVPGAAVGTGYAHAKAILLGEHAVVYGAPALAIPVHGLGVEVRLQLAPEGIHIDSELFSGEVSAAPEQVRSVVTALRSALGLHGVRPGAHVRILSSIPHERGLGSSAAVAAAVVRAVAELGGVDLVADELYRIVQQAERVSHGNPSGLDARAVVADNPICFQRGRVEQVRVGRPLTFVLADSGEPGSTARAVAEVRTRREVDQRRVEQTFGRIAELTEGAVQDVREGDLADLGARMSETHLLLAGLGVSHPLLDALVDAAAAAGSAGAKLTGGGQGGCVIALADSEGHADVLGSALRDAGAARTWTTTVPAS